MWGIDRIHTPVLHRGFVSSRLSLVGAYALRREVSREPFAVLAYTSYNYKMYFSWLLIWFPYSGKRLAPPPSDVYRSHFHRGIFCWLDTTLTRCDMWLHEIRLPLLILCYNFQWTWLIGTLTLQITLICRSKESVIFRWICWYNFVSGF
jgi:hypothetical protein